MDGRAGWLPAGAVAGRRWSCVLTLTDPATGRGRPVYRCFAEVCRRLPYGGWAGLARMDDSGQPDTGDAHPGGPAGSQLILVLPEPVTAGLPACDAALEVWVQPDPDADPYRLLQVPFPIRAKAADLP